MSADTDPPPAQCELKFHKDFESPSTAAILQAPDGTCFRFDFATLAMFSSFFEDLKSLPTPPTAPGADEEQIIPLPSTTEPALHFVLTAIKSILKGRFPTQIGLSESLCDAVIQTADAYDIPIIFPVLLKATEDKSHIGARTRLIIAILAHDKPVAQRLSLRFLRYRADYRRALVRALEVREPHALAELLNHWTLWLEALNDFENQATRGANYRFNNMFPKKCRKSTSACREVVKWRGDLDLLVSRETKIVRRSLINKPERLESDGCIYTANTGCADCDNRLQDVIARALDASLINSNCMLRLNDL